MNEIIIANIISSCHEGIQNILTKYENIDWCLFKHQKWFYMERRALYLPCKSKSIYIIEIHYNSVLADERQYTDVYKELKPVHSFIKELQKLCSSYENLTSSSKLKYEPTGEYPITRILISVGDLDIDEQQCTIYK